MGCRRLSRILLWLIPLLLVPSVGLAKGRKKRKPQQQQMTREAPPAEPHYDYNIALQIIEWPRGFDFPAVEFSRVVGDTARRPHAVSLSYWHYDDTTSHSAGRAKDGSGDIERDVVRGIRVLSARYKFHLMPSFHFNFGAGVREIFTRETLNYQTGRQVSVEKSALSAGLDIGLGNRWVLPSGIVIGGNWLQVFVPAFLIKGKDADIPPGYEDDDFEYHHDTVANGNREHDGNINTTRLAVFEIGYGW